MVNKKISELTGYTSKELVNNKINSILPILKLENSIINKEKRSKLFTKKNEKLLARIFITTINDNGNTNYLLFITNITDDVKKEQELVKTVETAEVLKNQALQDAEELRSQEEELKQNMEELATSQETLEETIKKVSQNEELVKTIMDNAPEAIVIINDEAKIEKVNKTFTELFKYKEHEVKNKEHEFIFKYLKFEKMIYGTKKRTKIETKDEKTLMVDINIVKIKDGEVNKRLLFIKDITEALKKEQNLIQAVETAEMLKNKAVNDSEEIKSQEEELRQNIEELAASQETIEDNLKQVKENEELIKQIINNAPDNIIICDNKGRVIKVNKTFNKHFGYSNEEISDLKFDILFPYIPYDKLDNGTKKRTRAILKNGSKILTDIGIVFVKSNGKTNKLFFVKDVTQEVKKEQELIRIVEFGVLDKKELDAQKIELQKKEQEIIKLKKQLNKNN